jgi:hypothetical protein
MSVKKRIAKKKLQQYMGYYLAYLGVPDLGHPKIPNNKAAT